MTHPDRSDDGTAAPTPSQPAAPETFCTSGPSPTLHLVGPGRVGRALCRRLAAAGIRLIGATDSTATWFDRDGIDPLALAAHKAAGRPLAERTRAESLPASLAIALVAADVVIDASATDGEDPWPAVRRGDAALTRGAALALAGKDGLGAAVHRWLDVEHRARVGCNAVLGGTGAALVAELDELRHRAGSAAVVGNATTTVVLRAIEDGLSLEQGIERAREGGMLEADPELDLRGHDAATKLAIVAGALTGRAVDPHDLPAVDVREVDCDLVRERARRGATTRLIGRWERGGRFTLGFEELGRTDALAVPPDRVAYGYRLDDGSQRLHVGAGIGPDGTADALFVDVVRLCRAVAEVRR